MEKVFLKKILAQNFRNLRPEIYQFNPGINCIFGPNGNGKTNLLEAVYFLTNKKSFRKNTNFSQILSFEGDKSEIVIQSVFNINNVDVPYSGTINAESEAWYLNQSTQKKQTFSKSVFINPFDSYSFHSSSSFRRIWVDQKFCEIDDEYKKTLLNFEKSLKFRNNLLQKKPTDWKNQLVAIDEQYVENCLNLKKIKINILNSLNKIIPQTFKEIFSDIHTLELKLDSEVNLDPKIFRDALSNCLEKDQILGHTTLGAHRDDYIFEFDGLNSFEFCSLGQQKMAFLSLIFAYIELFRYKFKTYPIVLIDDVSGELDAARWRNLIGYLEKKEFQVLITTANHAFQSELEKIPQSKKFLLDNGSQFAHG
jgi:DNA replication and repair protein RecF